MLRSGYPVLCADDVRASAAFYREHFGFEPTFESDWYVSPRHPDVGTELAVLDLSHESVSEATANRPAACWSTSSSTTSMPSPRASRPLASRSCSTRSELFGQDPQCGSCAIRAASSST